MEEINKARESIDDIDRQVLDLLNRRAAHVLAIGEIKKRHTLPVFDPGREEKIINRLQEGNQGPLSESAVKHIFKAIIHEQRSMEEENNRAEKA